MTNLAENVVNLKAVSDIPEGAPNVHLLTISEIKSDTDLDAITLARKEQDTNPREHIKALLTTMKTSIKAYRDKIKQRTAEHEAHLQTLKLQTDMASESLQVYLQEVTESTEAKVVQMEKQVVELQERINAANGRLAEREEYVRSKSAGIEISFKVMKEELVKLYNDDVNNLIRLVDSAKASIRSLSKDFKYD